MSTKLRRFAPLGLVLAGAAALFAIGYYLVERKVDLILEVSLALIVVGLALFVILDPGRVRRALTGRQARYGSNALVLTIGFLGILVVVNVLVFQNTKTWDLTEDKSYTLAKETLQTLQSLPGKVTATAFFTSGISPESAKSLLQEYHTQGKGKFDFSFVDPDQNPVAARQAAIAHDGTIVLAMGDQKVLVESPAEQDLTAGLVRLMNPQSQVIYFLTGHGEHNPDDTGDMSYSQVKRLLTSKNYGVKNLNLLTENTIPSDAQVIVIAGPQKPISADEVSKLKDFQSKGGGLVVLSEPSVIYDLGPDDSLASYMQQSWGITLDKDMVIDTTSQSPFAPFANQYTQSAITNPLQNTTAQFPTAHSVEAGQAAQGVTVQPLVLTAAESWGETDLAGLKSQPPNISFDKNTDLPGPVALAASGEDINQKSRVVVFGDADFPADVNFSAYANGDLFANAVDWAANREDLISLNPKANTQRLLAPPKAVTMNLILLGMVILIPGIALVSGGWVWWQHRRRG